MVERATQQTAHDRKLMLLERAFTRHDPFLTGWVCTALVGACLRESGIALSESQLSRAIRRNAGQGSFSHRLDWRSFLNCDLLVAPMVPHLQLDPGCETFSNTTSVQKRHFRTFQGSGFLPRDDSTRPATAQPRLMGSRLLRPTASSYARTEPMHNRPLRRVASATRLRPVPTSLRKPEHPVTYGL